MIMKINIISKIHIIYSIFGYTSLQDLHHIYIIRPCLKVLFQIHWFLGISAGLILSIMGVTGAIYSYDQQILKWVNTDSYVVQVQSSPKLTPAQLYQHFTTIQPEIKINSITIAKDPTASSVVNIEKKANDAATI